MMIKRTMFFLLAAGIAANISAMDWSKAGREPLTLKSEVPSGNATNAVLQDASGRMFSVLYNGPVTATQINRVLAFRDIFYSWPGIRISELRFTVDEANISSGIGVTSFVYSRTDMTPYLPAGLEFRYDSSLQYGFRMVMNNNVFVKIQGEYSTLDEMCGKMLEAVRDPVTYTRKREPEFILQKLEELEKRQNDLRRAGVMLYDSKQISQEAVDIVVRARKANPSGTVSQLKDECAKKNIKLSTRQIKAILTVYFNEFPK